MSSIYKWYFYESEDETHEYSKMASAVAGSDVNPKRAAYDVSNIVKWHSNRFEACSSAIASEFCFSIHSSVNVCELLFFVVLLKFVVLWIPKIDWNVFMRGNCEFMTLIPTLLIDRYVQIVTCEYKIWWNTLTPRRSRKP